MSKTPFVGRLLDKCEKVNPRQPNLLRVLTYHRVDDPNAHPELDPATLSATPADFEEQLRFLADRYHVVPMAAALEACHDGPPLPPLAVLITFDDAYCDFAENVWPVLKRYKLPATLFVPTAYPDQPERTFWWDRIHRALTMTSRREDIETPLGKLQLRTAALRYNAVRRLKTLLKTLPHDVAMDKAEQLCATLEPSPPCSAVLGWDSLRQLARDGVTLAPHTQTHPLLNHVDTDRAGKEIQGSFGDLHREVGAVLPVFAYPGGAVNSDSVKLLRRIGVALAFTTSRGINNLSAADPLRLRRINVGRHTSLAVLRLQLLTWARGQNLATCPGKGSYAANH